MGLETVVDDIKDEARTRAEEIVQEAEEEAEEILEEARGESESIKQEERESAEKRAEELREQEISSAKLEARKMRSREQRDLLAELRADVSEELAGTEEGREEMTRNLLEGAIEELGEDTGTVYSSEGDEELVEGILDDYGGFEYGGTTEVLGGVVVEASDGDVRVNNSFDSVLETVWSGSLKEVSERLLGET
ncbi:MAG: V-type ATP synthase subunit E [Halobacteriales archaeon]|nr:V-type ATP synthase subunit E [Halobacteriales archaeon]